MAELADAPDSKSGIREDVWVRPPPSAPLFFIRLVFRNPFHRQQIKLQKINLAQSTGRILALSISVFGLKVHIPSIALRLLLHTDGPAGTQTAGSAGVRIGGMTPGLAGMGTEPGATFDVGGSFFTAGSRGVTVKPKGLIPGTFS